MRRKERIASVAGLWAVGLWAPSFQATAQTRFDGAAALEATGHVVSFGPRPASSPAHRKLRQWLRSELRPLKCEIVEDAFTAATPRGSRPMTNLIAKFPGASGRVVVISGHYDTYDRPGLHFVGANDGGSSTGFLLQLARALARLPHRDSIWLVWFDGEESMAAWQDEDGRLCQQLAGLNPRGARTYCWAARLAVGAARRPFNSRNSRSLWIQRVSNALGSRRCGNIWRRNMRA